LRVARRIGRKNGPPMCFHAGTGGTAYRSPTRIGAQSTQIMALTRTPRIASLDWVVAASSRLMAILIPGLPLKTLTSSRSSPS
jgi:hypothetical protein